MKAPDKIYINNYNGNDTWGNQWHSKPSQNPSVVSHEYICKDALLEWAKETYLNENASEIRKVCYKQLIDKLNSM